MKQIAQNYKSGEIALLEVPVPACKPGGVLVRTDFSLISMGTEAMKIHESKLSLLGKARARPDQVKKVAQTLAQQGPVATYQKVMNRLDSYTPLGYSLSGVVVDVGAGVDEFKVGQRVACGGNLYALHAEYNWVPKNLCVAIPDGVPALQASFATVGSIAMQGFRQSEAGLGETACVIGLGLVGQILVQILRAAGVNVVGIDVSEERCRLAEASGAAACGVPGAASLGAMKGRLAALTGGAGADHVFLAAGGGSNQPVEMAAELARDRARIVDIGKCKLDLPWNAYYEKELDLRFSRSYGPGRYDSNYEEGGIDYPAGYVRWTERRNMECIIDLLACGKLDFEPIISDVLSFDEAVSVYEKINTGELGGLGIVFRYPEEGAEVKPLSRVAPVAAPKPQVVRNTLDRVRLGVIGCGNYATTMLLPHLKSHADVDLVEVATATSLSTANAQAKFGFERVSTDFRALLASDDIDAVLIATRHDSHAFMVGEALRAGKAVFVEKPLAVSPEQLAAIRDAICETGNDRVMVGFNRRFARVLTELKSAWGSASGPQILNYTVNAGPLEAGSWYGQSELQGTRFAGEGGHFIDTASWWLGSDPVGAFATCTADDPDNVVATFVYENGSIAKIAYLTTGDPKFPKEVMEVFGGGKVARLQNFKRTELWQGGRCRKKRMVGIDKGQKEELAAFVEAVKSGGPMPISPESLFATTAATLAAVRSSATGRTERIADWENRLEEAIETQAPALPQGADEIGGLEAAR
jgi:predicted dehydrogenase/threonine dehydrogenase-like Zn-dependent dehydrogenase